MKNKGFFLLILLCGCFSAVFSQEKITWNDLSKVTYEDKYFDEYDEYFKHPTFSSSVKALDGKEVMITGYFLDVDPEGTMYVLSKGPLSSCFFCGVGGPETAIELYFSSKPNFKMDDVVSITGVLELNDKDIDHFNYILKGCRGKAVN
jgi:hypothetical protein